MAPRRRNNKARRKAFSRWLSQSWMVDEMLKFAPVFFELRVMKFAAQELGYDFLFAQGSQDRKSGITFHVFGLVDFTPQQRQCNHDQQNHHEHQLHENYLAQSLMEDANTQNHRAAECQLCPAGIGDLARHFIGDYHGAQRINPSRDRVKDQQSRQSPIVPSSKCEPNRVRHKKLGMAHRPRTRSERIRNTRPNDIKRTGRASRSLWRAAAETGNMVLTTGPGAHIYQPSDQRYRRINSSLSGAKVLHQDDVEVVDDDLAENHNRLHAFPEDDRYAVRTHRFAQDTRTGFCQKVGCDDGDHAGEHRPFHAQANSDWPIAPPSRTIPSSMKLMASELNSFDSLDVFPAHSEWNVESHS